MFYVLLGKSSNKNVIMWTVLMEQRAMQKKKKKFKDPTKTHHFFKIIETYSILHLYSTTANQWQPTQPAFLTRIWQFHTPGLRYMLQQQACNLPVGDSIPVYTILHTMLQAEPELEVKV